MTHATSIINQRIQEMSLDYLKLVCTNHNINKRRIMDMGITKGSEIFIRKVAPLGDPVEITVRGYELSVRKNDAQCVLVKEA